MKSFLIVIVLSLSFGLQATWDTTYYKVSLNAFKVSEKLNFKLYYNSFVTGDVLAGYMESEVKEYSLSDDYFKVEIEAKTRRAYNLFFKVEDYYTSYINKNTLLPAYFKKRIREGKYTADRDVRFNHAEKFANYIDNEKKTEKKVEIPGNIHDLLSSLYYLRNINFDTVEVDDRYKLNFFLDGEVFSTELRFTGYETIETELGEIDCMKFKPRVLKGNVFDDEEPLTVWVSDDKNKLPIKAESEIKVGSVKIVLTDYKNLKSSSNAIRRD